MADDYFTPQAVHREILVWAVGVRLQLDRWEHLVAAYLRETHYMTDEPSASGSVIWQAQIERHFCLVAARHLLRALDMLDSTIYVDPPVREELIAGRDLHEHWDENMPVFNRHPRIAQPKHASGKKFAQRNPDRTPYWWLEWNEITGPQLTPKVPASVLHALLDRVEARILQESPSLTEFLPARLPSPWAEESASQGWWVRADAAEDH